MAHSRKTIAWASAFTGQVDNASAGNASYRTRKGVMRYANNGQGHNWSGCPLVEVVPGKVSGAPILKGTRLPAQTIVDNHDYGMAPAEIAEQFGVTEDQVRQILDYARSHARKATRPRAPSAARP